MDQLPVARRQISPVWLAVGAVALLAVCGCSGLFLHAVSIGPSKPSTSPSAVPAAVGTGQPVAAGGPHAVPDLIGVRLSDATQRLRAAGFPKSRVVDVTGKGRIVINPANWVVRLQEPAVGSRVAASTRIVLRVGKATDLLTTAPAALGVVPNVVCRDLSTAQSALRDAGFYLLSSRDGTGQGRRQILDLNWVVTAQSVPAGTRPSLATRITLTVVKTAESTRC